MKRLLALAMTLAAQSVCAAPTLPPSLDYDPEGAEIISLEGYPVMYIRRIITGAESATEAEKALAKRFGTYDDLMSGVTPETAQVWVGTLITRSAEGAYKKVVISIPEGQKTPGEIYTQVDATVIPNPSGEANL